MYLFSLFFIYDQTPTAENVETLPETTFNSEKQV